ncbi:unnamed protein product, partial [Ectocarpus sp. 12 AP-2014]
MLARGQPSYTSSSKQGPLSPLQAHGGRRFVPSQVKVGVVGRRCNVRLPQSSRVVFRLGIVIHGKDERNNARIEGPHQGGEEAQLQRRSGAGAGRGTTWE